MLSHRQLFLQHVAQTSSSPLALEIARGEGIHLFDTSGKSYIDLIAGISVSNLGHCHPAVVAAVQEQAATYMHTLVYGEFVLSPQVLLAKLLAERMPAPLDCTYFVNSGTEATEGAMKLAKRYTGRREIISCYQSYHGSSQGALSLMSDTFFTAPFRPLLPNIKHIHYNNFDDLERITTATACVVVETVRAEIGVETPKNDYLKALRARCTATGTLLVLDEIQVGCGRTGSLWAFEQFDIVPDIVLLAKGFGGGMPIGAFVAPREIMQALTHNPFLGHITTFGGHAVTCAAALATMKVLTEEREIIGSVKQKEQLFHQYLQHEAIEEIRSAGLIMGVQVRDFDFVQAVIQECLRTGLITDWFLFNSSAIRIAPPLTISPAQIAEACQILLAAIDKTQKK
jgi:acetylornithine/N-succinyldiaminopimelate aminotransferase